MSESVARIERALHSADGGEQLVAQRIHENPRAWSRWEAEHSNLMRHVAVCGVPRVQVAALKHANFRLLHGTALFDYLRGSGVRGESRRRVLAHFRPGRHYDDAMVAEHAGYVRKAGSYLCTSHLGAAIIDDPLFIDPMQRYEELYREYFELYCRCLTRDPGSEEHAQVSLLPLLKHQLGEYRWAILDPRRAQPWLRREKEIRVPSGDTQRLTTLGPRRAGF